MIQRAYIPGSPWLYYKLYTGHKTADAILVERILPYVGELFMQGLIDKFFFIRYNDPDFHIRFRIHMPDKGLYDSVFCHFYSTFQPCIDNGQVIKIQCDTYTREIERYGDQTMALLEDLFWIDSQCILELLSRITTITDVREQIRWQLSLVLLDDTMEVFGLEIKDRQQLMERMSKNFKREFGFTYHAFTKQLNDKYRAFRNDIEQCIAFRSHSLGFEDILLERKKMLTGVASQIKQALPANDQGPNLDDLLSSIQHMTMNRWFRSKNRQHELVIYDFLNKYYTSKLARM